MNKGIFVLFFMLMTGCAGYTLVSTGAHNIDGFIVSPTMLWNKVPSMASSSGSEMWTADGVMLNSVTFFSGIMDGRTLYKSQGDNIYPEFKANMLPNDIMELVESSVSKFYQVTTADTGELKPVSIDNNQGFEFTMSMVGQDNVKRKCYVAGAVKNASLYLVIYQAPVIHYYDKYLQDVRVIVNTASIQ